MTDEMKLKSCPFCGIELSGPEGGAYGHPIGSPDCILSYNAIEPCDVERWNTRALQQPSEDEVERVAHPLTHNPDCGVNSTGACDCGIYEAARWKTAVEETQRFQRDLDVTNADHIALWLEANTVLDEPMSQCISWLACRIVEAHEAAIAAMRGEGE